MTQLRRITTFPVVFVALFAFADGSAAQVEILSVTSGLSMSLDGRFKTKRVGDLRFPLVVDGDLPAGERSIVCTGRVFDGVASNGLPKRRKGVQVKFQGRIVDAADGRTLQVLQNQKAKTNKAGDFLLELPLGNHSEFEAEIVGTMKKKRTTGAFFSCTAAPAAGAAARDLAKSERQAAARVPDEVNSWGYTRSIEANGGEDEYRGWLANVLYGGARDLEINSCFILVGVVDASTGQPVEGKELTFIASRNPAGGGGARRDISGTTNGDGIAEIPCPRWLQEWITDSTTEERYKVNFYPGLSDPNLTFKATMIVNFAEE